MTPLVKTSGFLGNGAIPAVDRSGLGATVNFLLTEM